MMNFMSLPTMSMSSTSLPRWKRHTWAWLCSTIQRSRLQITWPPSTSIWCPVGLTCNGNSNLMARMPSQLPTTLPMASSSAHSRSKTSWAEYSRVSAGGRTWSTTTTMSLSCRPSSTMSWLSLLEVSFTTRLCRSNFRCSSRRRA